MTERRGDGASDRKLGERMGGSGTRDLVSQRMIDAGDRVEKALALIGRRDAALLRELLEPRQVMAAAGAERWRQVVVVMAGETGRDAQPVAIRSACENLVLSYREVDNAAASEGRLTVRPNTWTQAQVHDVRQRARPAPGFVVQEAGMGRLTSLKPQLGSLRPRIAPARDAQGHSRTAEPWRAWYSLARWRRLRWSVLSRDLFTCACCSRLESDTSQLVADHIRPHRGDLALFWDETNLTTLCKPCHDRVKQAEEHRTRHHRG